MTATAAKIGFGATFAIGTGTGSPETFTNVAEVVSITPPAITAGTVDATHMQSPNGVREFIPGLKEGGEVTIEVNYTPANTTALMAPLSVTANKNYKITLPDGSTWAFAAAMTGFTPDTVTVDGKMTSKATFKVSGLPVFTAGP